VAGVAGFVGLAALGGIALTLAKGGPTALMAAIAKSGFSAAFALIFVSEIGDKTFFIAALLAMQYSRLLVHIFGGCSIFLMCCTLYCDSHAAFECSFKFCYFILCKDNLRCGTGCLLWNLPEG
jgi:hypothetical protein